MKGSRSYLGADIDTDHHLVMMHCESNFKRIIIKQNAFWDVIKLKKKSVYNMYMIETNKISEYVNRLLKLLIVEDNLSEIKKNILDATENVLGRTRLENGKEWISKEVFRND